VRRPTGPGGRTTVRPPATIPYTMKPTTRLSLTALLALLTVTRCAGTADAATAPGLGVDPPYGPPLTIIKLSGTGFCPAPCGPIQITIASVRVDSASLTWHPNRTFTAFAQVPGSARPGDVPVVATQTDNNGQQVAARTRFAVTINAPAPKHYPTPTSLQPPGGPPPPAHGSPQPTHHPAPTTLATTSSPAATPTSTSPADHPSGASSHQSGGSSSPTGPILALTGAALAAAVGAIAVTWWYRRRRTP
jgi:hypothetical protein